MYTVAIPPVNRFGDFAMVGIMVDNFRCGLLQNMIVVCLFWLNRIRTRSQI